MSKTNDIRRANADDELLSGAITGDTYNRVEVRADGTIWTGDGTAPPSVQIGGATPPLITSGEPTDGDFDETPPNGTIAIDGDTDLAYYRKASVWTPLGAPPAPAAPGAPTIGTATAGNTTVTVNWTAGASNGSPITGYEVTLYLAADDTVVATHTTGVVLTYQFTGRTNGAGVYGQVAAINAIDTGPQSAASNTVTPSTAISNPGDIAGLIADYDPDTNTGTNGSNVSTLADSSTSGYTAGEANVALQPTIVTNAFGSHRGVAFNGSQQLTSSLPADTKPFTVIAAIKATDLTAYMGILAGTSPTGGMELRIEQTTGHVNILKENLVSVGESSVGVVAGTACIVVARYSASGVWTIHVGGGANVGTGTNDLTFTASTTKLGGPGFKGLVGRWIKYDHDLTLSDENLVSAWLGTRLGIAWSTAT